MNNFAVLGVTAMTIMAALGVAAAASTRTEQRHSSTSQYKGAVFDAVVARSLSISMRVHPENVGTTGVVNLRSEKPTHFDTLGIPVLPRKDYDVVSAAAIRQAYLRRAIAHHPHKVLFSGTDRGGSLGFPPANATVCELWGKRECLRWRNRDGTVTLAYPDVDEDRKKDAAYTKRPRWQKDDSHFTKIRHAYLTLSNPHTKKTYVEKITEARKKREEGTDKMTADAEAVVMKENPPDYEEGVVFRQRDVKYDHENKPFIDDMELIRHARMTLLGDGVFLRGRDRERMSGTHFIGTSGTTPKQREVAVQVGKHMKETRKRLRQFFGEKPDADEDEENDDDDDDDDENDDDYFDDEDKVAAFISKVKAGTMPKRDRAKREDELYTNPMREFDLLISDATRAAPGLWMVAFYSSDPHVEACRKPCRDARDAVIKAATHLRPTVGTIAVNCDHCPELCLREGADVGEPDDLVQLRFYRRRPRPVVAPAPDDPKEVKRNDEPLQQQETKEGEEEGEEEEEEENTPDLDSMLRPITNAVPHAARSKIAGELADVLPFDGGGEGPATVAAIVAAAVRLLDPTPVIPVADVSFGTFLRASEACRLTVLLVAPRASGLGASAMADADPDPIAVRLAHDFAGVVLVARMHVPPRDEKPEASCRADGCHGVGDSWRLARCLRAADAPAAFALLPGFRKHPVRYPVGRRFTYQEIHDWTATLVVEGPMPDGNEEDILPKKEDGEEIDAETGEARDPEAVKKEKEEEKRRKNDQIFRKAKRLRQVKRRFVNNNNRRRQAIFWGAFDGTTLATEGEPLSCLHDSYVRASLAITMLADDGADGAAGDDGAPARLPPPSTRIPAYIPRHRENNTYVLDVDDDEQYEDDIGWAEAAEAVGGREWTCPFDSAAMASLAAQRVSVRVVNKMNTSAELYLVVGTGSARARGWHSQAIAQMNQGAILAKPMNDPRGRRLVPLGRVEADAGADKGAVAKKAKKGERKKKETGPHTFHGTVEVSEGLPVKSPGGSWGRTVCLVARTTPVAAAPKSAFVPRVDGDDDDGTWALQVDDELDDEFGFDDDDEEDDEDEDEGTEEGGEEDAGAPPYIDAIAAGGGSGEVLVWTSNDKLLASPPHYQAEALKVALPKRSVYDNEGKAMPVHDPLLRALENADIPFEMDSSFYASNAASNAAAGENTKAAGEEDGTSAHLFARPPARRVSFRIFKGRNHRAGLEAARIAAEQREHGNWAGAARWYRRAVVLAGRRDGPKGQRCEWTVRWAAALAKVGAPPAARADAGPEGQAKPHDPYERELAPLRGKDGRGRHFPDGTEDESPRREEASTDARHALPRDLAAEAAIAGPDLVPPGDVAPRDEDTTDLQARFRKMFRLNRWLARQEAPGAEEDAAGAAEGEADGAHPSAWRFGPEAKARVGAGLAHALEDPRVCGDAPQHLRVALLDAQLALLRGGPGAHTEKGAPGRLHAPWVRRAELDALERLAGVRPGAASHAAWARALRDAGDLRAARRVAEDALAEWPGALDHELRAIVGQALHARGCLF